MAWYYNRGRGNLSLTLPEGRSVSFPGNNWIELVGKDQTCASVLRAIRKGQLFRSEKNPNAAAAPTSAPAPVAAPVPAAPPKGAAPAPAKISSTAAPVVEKTEEVKTPATGDEATVSATDAPKPSTAGKSKKTHRFGE